MSITRRGLIEWFLGTVAHRMARKTRPEDIRAFMRKKAFRRAEISQPTECRRVQVAVVQEQIAVLKTYKAYAERMIGFVQSAVDQGAQLVCFPEENGVLLFGQIPLIDLILRLVPNLMAGQAAPVGKKTLLENVILPGEKVGIPAAAPGAGLAPLLSPFSPFLQAAFEATFSEIARGFGVYLMAGSLMMVEGGLLRNRAFLFDPQGRRVGVQDKAHPIELEIAIGLACGNELRVFDTALGRLAFPVCMDATYFETFKILKKAGAQIVMVPIANLEAYEYSLTLRGIWPRVQESGVYGLKSALVGSLAGLEFTGKAGIYAPLALTADHSGVIAEAKSFDQDEVVCASLDLDQIEAYSSDYFSDTNPALYRKYFPGIYQQET